MISGTSVPRSWATPPETAQPDSAPPDTAFGPTAPDCRTRAFTIRIFYFFSVP